MYMKMLVKIGFILFLICFASCNTDKIYTEEQYKNVVYLLSGSENIYTESYTLNDAAPVKYFSVVCGGTRPNDKEVTVTIVPDLDMFHAYNRRNFDSESLYAKLLPESRYQIASYTATIPANPTDQYVKVPVRVNPHGLSPDSVYFIPLTIKSVSRYEVNENKNNMLYRVTIENDYARQKVATYYAMRGVETNRSNNAETMLSGAKLVQPLTKNKVRMFAGNYTQGRESTVADIQRLAMVVEIKEDNTIDITPYGSMQVVTIRDNPLYNIYDPKAIEWIIEQRTMYLHYRYRVMNNNGIYGDWQEVKEILVRIEED